MQGVDVVVHFAGVLFAPRPERFLPKTNLGWFSNLLDAALHAGVRRVILISFPHVEGPTSFDEPATVRPRANPIRRGTPPAVAKPRYRDDTHRIAPRYGVRPGNPDD
jgi:nucleoside-diphosphate-sugar epimerase